MHCGCTCVHLGGCTWYGDDDATMTKPGAQQQIKPVLAMDLSGGLSIEVVVQGVVLSLGVCVCVW